MSRGRGFLAATLFVFCGLSRAQDLPPKEPDSPSTQYQLPPSDDKPKVDAEQFAFNPVKSKKAVEIGEFYFKKGDFRAAAGRFTEATKWNNGNAQAWLRLGDAEERMNDLTSARSAWEKYLELDPKGKSAPEVRKKIERLKAS
jgi:tetratricopeptide (TPR) repeat protein